MIHSIRFKESNNDYQYTGCSLKHAERAMLLVRVGGFGIRVFAPATTLDYALGRNRLRGVSLYAFLCPGRWNGPLRLLQ